MFLNNLNGMQPEITIAEIQKSLTLCEPVDRNFMAVGVLFVGL
jgi:hypothetical protein